MFHTIFLRVLPIAIAGIVSVIAVIWITSGEAERAWKSAIGVTEHEPSAGIDKGKKEKRGERAGEERSKNLRQREGDRGKEEVGLFSSIGAAAGRALRVTLAVLKWSGLTLLLLSALLAVTRTYGRRSRRYVRYEIVPYRTEEAAPEQERRLHESLHQMRLERWYRRIFLGQGGVVLEIHSVPDAAGTLIQFAIACPEGEGLKETLEGRLNACYPDCRLRHPSVVPTGVGEVVRLKRRYRGFTRSLRVPDHHDESSVVDSVVAVIQAAGEASTVQFALTPTPALFDRLARWVFRRQERGLERARVRSKGGDPGTRSEVVERELEGSAAGVQNRPLFFCDIRITASRYSTCRAIAGTIRGDSAGENRLAERRMRRLRFDWLGRRALYARRVSAALPNPIPSVSKGVYSSAELAGLWHLPSPYLKGVRMKRSSVPRVPAPPEILRPTADEALARDERGYVGIRTDDRAMNMMLVGGQKTGKTALVCRTIASDVKDPNCSVIVLDGKSDLAQRALGVIPADLGERKVHYLDFAHPEVGINPFAGSDRIEVADGIVEAFKAITEPGGIRESSERYLIQSALAAMAWAEKTGAEGGATLFDMWTLLMPSADEFRREVVRAIGRDPELAATAMFFGQGLPDQLRAARGMMTPRLDSPVNKLMRVAAQPRLDTILRHPVSLNIDEIIRNRDILVISGAVGTFGEGSAVVLLQFILHLIHRALIRQQELSEGERARVALKVDEAHLLFSDTFARMLAMDRSAGLECASAWQALGQIEDRDLRSVILNLHRNRCIFSVADDDAKELQGLLQAAYTSVIRDDRESRSRVRIPTDALIHLPNFHAACSWVSEESRVASFIAETIPMEENTEQIEHHLKAQRDRGAYFPGTLPPPRRDAGHVIHADIHEERDADRKAGRSTAEARVQEPSGSSKAGDDAAEGPSGKRGRKADPTQNGRPPKPGVAGDGIRSSAAPDSRGKARDEKPPRRKSVQAKRKAPPAASTGKGNRQALEEDDGVIPEYNPEESSHDDSVDRIGVAPLGSDTGVAVPDSFTELDFEDVTGFKWEGPPPGRSLKPPSPRRDDIEVLAALYELRFLLASQIKRRFMPTKKLRAVQHRLAQMLRYGWVRRAEIATGKAGHGKRVYVLAKGGFELLRRYPGRTRLARHIDEQETWRESEVKDPLLAVHDLHVNGWFFALEAMLRKGVVGEWRGARRSILQPPVERIYGQWLKLTPERVPLPDRQHLSDLALDEFEPVKPDLTVALNLSIGVDARKLDFLIEVDRSGRASSNLEKFKRYDALLNAWALSVPRYRMLGAPPMVVFVVEDDEKARQFLEVADKAMTGRIGIWGEPEESWPHYGRKRTIFVAERDAHMKTLRALRLPDHPPKLRRDLYGREAEKLVPKQIPNFIPAPFQRRGIG